MGQDAFIHDTLRANINTPGGDNATLFANSAVARVADDPTARHQIKHSDGTFEPIGASSVVNPGALASIGFFYGLTAGTGNEGPTDYAATIAAGAPVPFPRDGVSIGGAARVGVSTTSFQLPTAGTYKIVARVHTTEPGQIQLRLDGAALPETTQGNQNPTAGGHTHTIDAIIVVLAAAVVEVINPAGNAPALTITPADGSSTHANSQSLSIMQLRD